MYEYLPAFLGEEMPKYDGYKADIHPGISHVFQSAAFRYKGSQNKRCFVGNNDKVSFFFTGKHCAFGTFL